jgi:hypothetical protein
MTKKKSFYQITVFSCCGLLSRFSFLRLYPTDPDEILLTAVPP